MVSALFGDISPAAGGRAPSRPAVNLPEFSALVRFWAGREGLPVRGHGAGGTRCPSEWGPFWRGHHSLLKWKRGGGLGRPPLGKQRLLSCAFSELCLVPKGDREKRSKTQRPEAYLSACEGTGILQFSLPVCRPTPWTLLTLPPLAPLPKVLAVGWGEMTLARRSPRIVMSLGQGTNDLYCYPRCSCSVISLP